MAVMTAEPRLSRRTLERQGMTPEQELALLIQEQADDDTSYASTERGREWSLDAPAPGSDGGSVGDEMVGRDPWSLVDDAIDLGLDPTEVAYAGDIVDSIPSRGGLFGGGLVDPNAIPHATAGAYQNHKCRCVPCTKAWATYKRERRAAKRAEA